MPGGSSRDGDGKGRRMLNRPHPNTLRTGKQTHTLLLLLGFDWALSCFLFVFVSFYIRLEQEALESLMGLDSGNFSVFFCMRRKIKRWSERERFLSV